MLGDILKALRKIKTAIKIDDKQEAVRLINEMLGEDEEVIEEKPVKRKRGRPKKKPEVVVETPRDYDGVIKTPRGKNQVKFTGNKFKDSKKIKVDKEDGYDSIDDNYIIRSKRMKSPSKMMTCSVCQKTHKVYLRYIKDGDAYKCERCAYKEVS